MFKAAFVLAVLMPISIFATPLPKNFALQCTTSVAAIRLWVEGDRFRFHLDDSSGFQNFPIYNGVVSPIMMPLVQRGMKELAKLDGDVTVEWDASKCTYDETRPMLVACSGLGKVTTPTDSGLFATSIGTSQEQVESLDVSAQVLHVNMGINVDSATDPMHYFISFPFDQKNHCSVNAGVQK